MLVLFVSLMHVLWGATLLWNGDAIGTTGTWALRVAVGEHHYVVRAVIYVVAGLLPAVLIRWPGSLAGLLSCLPQQALLILSGISAIVSISNGHYADGTARSLQFITMDQGIYVILAVLYAVESVDRYQERGEENYTLEITE